MRHSIETEYRKYIKGYGFLSFARNFGNKYDKKLMNSARKTDTKFSNKYGKKLTDTAIKTGKDFTATAGKSAEATGDLIYNKIADKITSLNKPRSKKEKDETNVMEETRIVYTPRKKKTNY